jgi:thioredoxin reductase
MSEVEEVDVVVVGGWGLGLAAASWLGRYRRSVVVVDSGEYRARDAERSHGYLGRDPQTPLELIARGREEVLAYPTAQIRSAKVERISRREDGLFDVDGELLAHRVVLATGVEDALPDVEGMDEHYGASVFHCPACDGYEARDRDVVALGWDPQLVGFSATLKNWARSVTVVTNGRRFQGDESCRVQMADNEVDLIEEDALAFTGSRGNLEGVKLQSGRLLPATLVFFSIAHQPQVRAGELAGLRAGRRGLREGRRRGADLGARRLRGRRPGARAAAGADRRGQGRGRGRGCGAELLRPARRAHLTRPGPEPHRPRPGRLTLAAAGAPAAAAARLRPSWEG